MKMQGFLNQLDNMEALFCGYTTNRMDLVTTYYLFCEYIIISIMIVYYDCMQTNFFFLIETISM